MWRRKNQPKMFLSLVENGEEVVVAVDIDIDADVDVDRYSRVTLKYLPCCRYENE